MYCHAGTSRKSACSKRSGARALSSDIRPRHHRAAPCIAESCRQRTGTTDMIHLVSYDHEGFSRFILAAWKSFLSHATNPYCEGGNGSWPLVEYRKPRLRNAAPPSDDKGGCGSMARRRLSREGFGAPGGAAVGRMRRYAELQVGNADRPWRAGDKPESRFHREHAVVAQQQIGMAIRQRAV